MTLIVIESSLIAIKICVLQLASIIPSSSFAAIRSICRVTQSAVVTAEDLMLQPRDKEHEPFWLKLTYILLVYDVFTSLVSCWGVVWVGTIGGLVVQ